MLEQLVPVPEQTVAHKTPEQLSANNRRRKDIYKLPRADQELLTALGYKSKLHEVDEAIIENAKFIKRIVANPEIFGHDLEDEQDMELVHYDAQDLSVSHSHGISF